MRIRSRLLLLLLLSLTTQSILAQKQSRCLDLFGIHRGYNAFKNILGYAQGYRPNLKKARIVYDNFPAGNDALRQSGGFIISNVLKDTHPGIDILMSEISIANGQSLSNLSHCSKALGEVAFRKYHNKLKNTPEYQGLYYQTFLLDYPLSWDSNSIREDFPTTAAEFIQEYDAYLAKATPLSENEKLLYDLFKMEIAYETAKDETAFLSGLEQLILSKPDAFSVLNYQQFIQEYFPKHPIPANLNTVQKDSFDKEDNHPSLIKISNSYTSFSGAVNEFELNPYDEFLGGYGNVKKLLPKTSFTELMKQVQRLDTIAATIKPKCTATAIVQNFLNQVIDCNDPHFTAKQSETLKAEHLRKWVESHIRCNITIMFYMEDSMVKRWDALGKTNQQLLMAYFIKALEESDNHSYLLELQKKLKVKP